MLNIVFSQYFPICGPAWWVTLGNIQYIKYWTGVHWASIQISRFFFRGKGFSRLDAVPYVSENQKFPREPEISRSSSWEPVIFWNFFEFHVNCIKLFKFWKKSFSKFWGFFFWNFFKKNNSNNFIIFRKHFLIKKISICSNNYVKNIF